MLYIDINKSINCFIFVFYIVIKVGYFKLFLIIITQMRVTIILYVLETTHHILVCIAFFESGHLSTVTLLFIFPKEVYLHTSYLPKRLL